MKMRRIGSIVMAAVLTVALFSGCTSDKKTKSDTGTSSASSSGTDSVNHVGTVYADKEYGFQLEAPKKGEEIAIMHTAMGDITIRFFPEAAPKAVENFKSLSKKGFYDGLTFHRVINDFMIQSGDPTGTGTGGQSIWGTKFDDEFDQKLLNLRGALAMANSGANTNSSQFFINQAQASSFKGKSYFESNADDYKKNYSSYQAYYQKQYNSNKSQLQSNYPTWQDYFKANYYLAPDPTLVPDSIWDLYGKYGGNIALDAAWRESGGYTVFGQVFKGLDVVDKIAAVKTDSNDKPTASILINTIEITTYEG